MLPPFIHIICSLFLNQTCIEEPPPAVMVHHPPQKPAHSYPFSILSWLLCVYRCGVWFAPGLRGDVSSVRPPIISINFCCRWSIAKKEGSNSNRLRTRGSKTIDTSRWWSCNIGNREETFVRRGEGKHIYHVAAVDLVHLHSQAFWWTYLACASHRPTPYPPWAGLSTVPTFTISWHLSAEYGRRR